MTIDSPQDARGFGKRIAVEIGGYQIRTKFVRRRSAVRKGNGCTAGECAGLADAPRPRSSSSLCSNESFGESKPVNSGYRVRRSVQAVIAGVRARSPSTERRFDRVLTGEAAFQVLSGDPDFRFEFAGAGSRRRHADKPLRLHSASRPARTPPGLRPRLGCNTGSSYFNRSEHFRRFSGAKDVAIVRTGGVIGWHRGAPCRIRPATAVIEGAWHQHSRFWNPRISSRPSRGVS
jgi:hypothetical protein